MELKVCKFGGTSVADATRLRRVESIVRADAGRCWVVPSAPGKRNASDQKITDLLYLCHDQAKRGQDFAPTFKLIRDRYTSIVAELGLKLDLAPILDEVQKRIAGGANADYAASRGEFIHGHVVAALLGWTFVDAAEIVKFDARGVFLPDETNRAAGARLKPNKHCVVSGFYGAMPDGSIKTFSRGGSDISGSIVARAVNADLYENWTDVSGLLMADPRVVPNPRPITTVTYRELRELAYMGATVLHEEAIFPVRESGITINIRNLEDPENPGTRIVSDREPLALPLPTAAQITGVAGRKGFSIIAIEKTLMNAEIGFARRILSVLEKHRISFEHMPSSIDTVCVVASSNDLNGQVEAVVDEIKRECNPDSIEVEHGIALIATVGRGMMHTPGIAARVMGALSAQSINIRMIDQGSGELNIILGIREEDFEAAVRAIYGAFVPSA